MYNFFKSVLKVAKEKHRKALAGKSNAQKKLQNELLEIQKHLQDSYQYGHELTKEQYEELAKEFGRISFNNLSEQRKGKYSL